MTAMIDFIIYQNFEKYLKEGKDYDYDYTKALNALNKQLKQLVKEDKLTFLYKGEKVKILLPINMNRVGNIFGKDDCVCPNWEGVSIPCRINCKSSEFDNSKLKVDKYPNTFEPVMVCWQ